MSTRVLSTDSDLIASFGEFLRSPLQLQTYKNLLYLILMFPLGIAYLNLILIGFFTGIPLALVGIGIPLLLVLFVIIIELAKIEQHLIRTLLAVALSVPKPVTDGSRWERTKQLVTASETWKTVVYLLSEFLYGTIIFSFLASGIATGVSFLLAPTYYRDTPVAAYWPFPTPDVTLDILFGWDSLLIGLTTTFRLASWHIETLVGALFVSGFGFVLLWITLLMGNVAAGLWAAYARRMLTTPRYWSMPW